MGLTNDDIEKIAQLLTPLENRIDSLETKVDRRFDDVAANFDALFRRDETREQEYLILRGQMARVEERVEKLEKQV